MKKAVRIIIPILLAAAILFCVAWYLLIYDREFTRDMLLQSARHFDSQGRHAVAGWLYDRAYELAGDNDAVAIELAEQHKADGNFTQAEATLSRAIEDGGSASLYIALSKTYLEQDKILDAVKLLNGITNSEIKAQLDQLRPAAPTAAPDPGFYNQYISVSLSAESGDLLFSTGNEYPSVYNNAYSDPIALVDGENTIYAVAVADNGLVSPLSVFGYTVGGVIEEINFSDKAFESRIRQILGVEEDEILFSNDLWEITSFAMPAESTSYADLRYMPFLQELTITDGVSDQLGIVSSLANLKTLCITDTPVSTDEMEAICSLTKLESLTLNGCGLSSIAGLDALSSLTYLDLSNNTIRNITPLASLSKLSEVHLQHNVLTDLAALTGIKNITKLDISYNSLTDLSPICSYAGLKWLDVSNNQLSSLSQIGKLTALEYLSAAFNSITDVSEIAKLTALTELNISNNSVVDIASLSSLVNIRKLDFSYNQVEALPTFDPSCALVSIDGSHNLLKTLDPLSGLRNLNSVSMDYNEEINSVECLANCPVLVVVNVYGTKVTEVESLTDQSIIVNFDPTQNA